MTDRLSVPSVIVPPEPNRSLFDCLFRLENALRELVIEELTGSVGSLWYKARLPDDVLDRYKRGREYQIRTRWAGVIPHHPLYYIEFPDLPKIITREDNWVTAFSRVFKRKEFLTAGFGQLEPIRNTIAHNRIASESDVAIARGFGEQCAALVGRERFEGLCLRSTQAIGIAARLSELAALLKAAAQAFAAYARPVDASAIEATLGEWWFDDSFLGVSVTPVRRFAAALREYEALPRHRGSGHTLEAWVLGSDIPALLDAATAALGQAVGRCDERT